MAPPLPCHHTQLVVVISLAIVIVEINKDLLRQIIVLFSLLPLPLLLRHYTQIVVDIGF